MSFDFMRLIREDTITNLVERYRVICFVAAEYPSLFFAQLRDIIKHNTIIETIDISQDTYQQCVARLSTSFLGTKIAFMLRGLDEIPPTKQDLFLRYVGTYEGPHTLMLSISPEIYNRHQEQCIFAHQSNVIVEIPDKIDEILFTDIISWFRLPFNPNLKRICARFFGVAKHISLEQVCVIIRYMPFGMHDRMLLERLFDTLIVPEQSLFTLSQYFFQKNMKKFLGQWRQATHIYAAPFWVSFWSDQLWRASIFVYLSKKGNHAEARKVSFRLPFSFTNKDWRNYTAFELTSAHDFLYRLDYRMKNNDASVGLDLFYITFLSNEFHTSINFSRGR